MLDMPEVTAFEKRGLDIEIAAKMGATSRSGAFRFEYRDRDELLSTKMRTADKKFWFEPKGQPLQLWNLDSLRGLPCRPREPLILTEGEFDAIAVAQSCRGVYIASVPNGGSSKRSQGRILVREDSGFSYLWGADEKLIHEIDQFDKIVIATDGDQAGLILRDELALRIGETRCWFVEYPKGCKDANDVLLRYREEGVQKLVSEAKPIRPGYLTKPSEIPPRHNEVRYSTGMDFLDRHMQIVRPELLIVTGEPGHGKGQLLRVLAFHLAESHGWRTAFLTPEDPAHRLKRDMMRFALRNETSRTSEEVERARRWCDDHFLISQPPEDEPITLNFVLEEMQSAALHHDCQMFVLDPWNEVLHDYERLTETQYTERALMLLKQKMRRCNLLLAIAAHPKKLDAGRTATLYDISGSSHWRNKADHGLIIYRKSNHSKICTLTVEKSKDHETMGIPGDVVLLLNRERCEYVCCPDEAAP